MGQMGGQVSPILFALGMHTCGTHPHCGACQPFAASPCTEVTFLCYVKHVGQRLVPSHKPPALSPPLLSNCCTPLL